MRTQDPFSAFPTPSDTCVCTRNTWTEMLHSPPRNRSRTIHPIHNAKQTRLYRRRAEQQHGNLLAVIVTPATPRYRNRTSTTHNNGRIHSTKHLRTYVDGKQGKWDIDISIKAAATEITEHHAWPMVKRLVYFNSRKSHWRSAKVNTS